MALRAAHGLRRDHKTNVTVAGLLLDLLGIVLLGISDYGWYFGEGYKTPGSWLSEGPVGSWIHGRGWDPVGVSMKVRQVGWCALILGFILQIIAAWPK